MNEVQNEGGIDRRGFLASAFLISFAPACIDLSAEQAPQALPAPLTFDEQAVAWAKDLRSILSHDPSPTNPETWNSLWETVSAGYSNDVVNLNPGSHGSPSLIVASSLRENAERHWHDSQGFYSAAEREFIDQIIPTAARLLGLGENHSTVYLTKNTTAGTEAVLTGFPFNADDEVIIASTEHPTASAYVKMREENSGVIRKPLDLPVGENVTAADIVKRYTDLVTPKTRFVLLSHISYVESHTLPVQQICQAIKAINPDIHIHVDGAHALGMMPIDIPSLGCDSYAASGHKWLGGPESSGVLWVSNHAKEMNFHPLIKDGNDPYTAATGAPNLVTALAFGEALKLHAALTPQRVWSRITELRAQVIEALKDNSKLKLISSGDPQLQSGMITYELVSTYDHQITPNDATVLAQKCAKVGLRIKNVTDFGNAYIRIGTPVSVSSKSLASGLELLRTLL